MGPEVQDYSIDQWRQLINEANSSELSKREWCAKVGISEKQFYYWQSKIRKIDSQLLTPEESEQTVPEESEQTVSEESVQVVTEESAPVVAEEQSAFVEITISDSTPRPTTKIERPLPPAPARHRVKNATVPSYGMTFRPEMALQADNYQLLIGGNITETALRTVMKVLRNA